MSHSGSIACDVVVALVSVALLLLGIALVIACKKKPVESDASVPIKVCAQHYNLADVDAATDGFHHRHAIGKGRLGTVYAAVLSTGDVIAIKRINPRFVLINAGVGFSSIVKSLSLAKHPNLVPLIGFSEAPGERIILMEFMGMKSLDFHLHQISEGAASFLDWGYRFRIASGAARGIEYLHEGMTPHIVHGCIKPSNILLDPNFCARVSDYGFSFLAPHERRGLVGYVDDEYWTQGGGVCKASDVYGFGVVLLELLTGKRCEEGLLVKWALPLIKEMNFVEFLDPRLVIPLDMKPFVRLAKVASACVSNSRKNRPSIGQVAAILNALDLQLSP